MLAGCAGAERAQFITPPFVMRTLISYAIAIKNVIAINTRSTCISYLTRTPNSANMARTKHQAPAGSKNPPGAVYRAIPCMQPTRRPLPPRVENSSESSSNSSDYSEDIQESNNNEQSGQSCAPPIGLVSSGRERPYRHQTDIRKRKYPLRSRYPPLETSPKWSPYHVLDNMIIEPETYYATMYDSNGMRIARTFIGANGDTNFVVAKPARRRRVFVGAVPTEWGLGTNPVIYEETVPIKGSHLRGRGSGRFFIGDETILSHRVPRPISPVSLLIDDAEPELADDNENRSTLQNNAVFTQSPLSSMHPNSPIIPAFNPTAISTTCMNRPPDADVYLHMAGSDQALPSLLSRSTFDVHPIAPVGVNSPSPPAIPVAVVVSSSTAMGVDATAPGRVIPTSLDVTLDSENCVEGITLQPPPATEHNFPRVIDVPSTPSSSSSVQPMTDASQNRVHNIIYCPSPNVDFNRAGSYICKPLK